MVRDDITYYRSYIFRVVETYKLYPETFVTQIYRRHNGQPLDPGDPLRKTKYTWEASKLCTVCANCYKPLDQHVKGKCLFQSTELLR